MMIKWMRIDAARVCLNCDILFLDKAWAPGDEEAVCGECPICNRRNSWPLRKWLPCLYHALVIGGSYEPVSKPYTKIQKRLEMLEKDVVVSDIRDGSHTDEYRQGDGQPQSGDE